jgi:Spx/MgsR family transcriptional regulator
MTVLYGINNCDTVKKAIKWLNNQHVNFSFHDFRKDGLTEDLLNHMLKQATWLELINKRSTTFRQLTDSDKVKLDTVEGKSLVLAQPTLLKRPILQLPEQLIIGFSEPLYEQNLAK